MKAFLPIICGLVSIAFSSPFCRAQDAGAVAYVSVADTPDGTLAKSMAGQLTTAGYPALAVEDGSHVSHVMVGPYASVDEADAAKAKFMGAGYKSARVISRDGVEPMVIAPAPAMTLEQQALARLGGPSAPRATGKDLEQKALDTAGVSAGPAATGAALEQKAVVQAGADVGAAVTGKALEKKSADAIALNAEEELKRREEMKQAAIKRAEEHRENAMFFLGLLSAGLQQASGVMAQASAVSAAGAANAAQRSSSTQSAISANASIHAQTQANSARMAAALHEGSTPQQMAAQRVAQQQFTQQQAAQSRVANNELAQAASLQQRAKNQAAISTGMNNISGSLNENPEIAQQAAAINAAMGKTAVSAADTATAGAGAAGSGDGSTMYTGPNAQWVGALLKTLHGQYSCAPVKPPVMRKDFTCQRDGQVYQAQQLAWAAECSEETGHHSDAVNDAKVLLQTLQSAKSLCGGSPFGGSCQTDTVFGCNLLPN